MKLRFILSLIISFSFNTSFSSTGKESGKKLERAETLYDGGNYADALPVFLELYAADSSNSNICYKVGSCYLKTGHQHMQATYFLKKAVLGTTANYSDDIKKERHAPIKSLKLLGDAFHLNNEFDLAIDSYKKYKQALITNKISDADHLKEIERKIETCIVAKELMANPADVQVVNMGASVNSSYPDYSPRLSADENTMVFTSKRPGTGGNTFDGGQYYEDIYISTRKGADWSPAVSIGSPINTVGNEAAIGLSADGQQILIYKDDFGNGNIYSSSLDGDKWSTPVKLNSNINSEWWEPCAFISSDANTLYFVSDRPGGYGGTDIYKSKKDSVGQWGKAINLGPTVNSPYDEFSPFIHPDGMTLFFSSKGHKTMGGFDVFYTRTLLNDENKWLEPANVGYPINSTGDDAFYMVSPDKKKAYYSSYRDNGLGEKDNYMVIFPESKDVSVALLKGTMVDKNEHAVKNGIITVTDKSTNQTGVYHPNSKTGEYLVVLTPGNYNISYEADGLLFYSVNQYIAPESKYFEQKKDIKLSSLDIGSKVTLNNIFFDFDESKLRPTSKAELDKLSKLLIKNPNLSVEVTGYADSKGSDDYNKKLSLERATAVSNYLNEKGIERSRVIPLGLGKETSEESLNENTNSGLRSSGRRVELKITNVK